MTLESAENKVQYATNGVTQAFSIPFKFLDNSHITVYFKDTGGVVTEPAFGSDFSMSGAGEAEGGTITFGAAPAASGTLTILREVPNTQTLDLENNDPFDANSIERAFDLLTMQVQQAEEKISRAVVLPPTSTDSTPDPGGYIEALEGLATTATTAATTATTAATTATTAAATAATAAADAGNAVASLAIGGPGGVCPLDEAGLVPAERIPANAGIPAGVIVMWSGAANAVPAGWALCDGAGGTPDLRGRFVVGAGDTYDVGSIGGEESHAHTAATEATTLTIAQMPSHAHALAPGASLGYNAPFYFVGSGTNNVLNFSPSFGTDSRGGGGSHNHTATVDESSNMPPYYALAFIMKV